MSEKRSVLLGKLTRREFRERMQSGELHACIIPVAATEQHLEHLAMEHDHRSCLLIAEQVAQRLNPSVIVAPSMNIGISGSMPCPAVETMCHSSRSPCGVFRDSGITVAWNPAPSSAAAFRWTAPINAPGPPPTIPYRTFLPKGIISISFMFASETVKISLHILYE